MLFGLENEVNYDPYNEPADEEPPFFYGPSVSSGMDTYADPVPARGPYYGAQGYYRGPAGYSSVGSYYVPTSAYAQNPAPAQRMFAGYSEGSSQ